MSGGFPLPLGFGPMPMPGAVDGDPGQMQLDDEQRRVIAARILGAQMFHPGNAPTAMDAFSDQGQDQGQYGGQAASAANRPAPTQAPTAPTFDSPLVRSLSGIPSMLGGQMPAPDMPAGPQRDAPGPGPVQIPSLLGAPSPQMPQPSGPQATGAIPQPVVPGQPQSASEGDEDTAPAVASGPAGAGAAPIHAAPTPPTRPSDFSAIDSAVPRSTGSFDPLTGQPVSGSPQPVRGDFDPLTGQPVLGSPRPMGAPAGSPGPAGAPSAAPGQGGKPEGSGFMQSWKQLADSGIGDQLIAFGSGLLSGRGASGWSQAGQNMLAVSQRQGAGDLQRLEYGLKVQKAQQEQAALTGNANFVKSVFAKNGQTISDQQALAFGSNSAVMNDLFKGVLPPTEQYTQETDKGGDTWQTNTRTGQRSLLKQADKDDVQLITDPVTGTVRAVRKSEVFGDKGGGGGSSGAGQTGGGNGGDATEGNVRTVFEGNRGFIPLTNPTARLKAGIRQNDDRAAWVGPDGKVTFEPTPPSTTINMPPAEKAEQSAIGTARAGIIKEHIEAGRAARDKVQILDQMRGALDAAGPNIMTGPLGEPVLRAKQALGGILGTQLPGTSATEMFANSGPVLAGAAARAITARPAQIEFTTMLNAKPGLMNSPEGNRASMDVMRQGAIRDADIADIAARSSSADEFIRKRDEYEHAHPMINPFTGKPFGSATPASPAPLINQGAAAPTLTELQAEARKRGLIR